jgi:Zn-dependent peptidase ImmA (M78 family)
LAEIIDVWPSAVSQYERGELTPSPEKTRQISVCLNLPIQFFLRPPIDQGNGPSFFRSMSSATKAARTRAERRCEWLQEIALTLQEYLRFPAVDFPKFDLPSDLSRVTDAMIEEAATNLRRHWGLGNGPIDNLTLLLENKGAIVARHTLDSEKLDAFSRWAKADDRPYVIFGADKACAARSKADGGHEAAHLVLHHNIDRTRLNKTSDFSLMEKQANRFAGAFLLPAETFLADLRDVTLDSLLMLKPRWGVSVGLMLHRAADLGAITESHAQRLWINLSRRRWRKKEPLDDKIPVEQPRLMKRSVSLLLDRGGFTRDELLAAIPWMPREIEELACLDEGTLTSPGTHNEEVAPELKIIPFPRVG